MDDRIALAEWLGDAVDWDDKGPFRWKNGKRGDFNPFEDANDCEAVIRKVVDQDYTVAIQLGPNGQSVDAISVEHDFSWVGDDWKTGVCELALKVIRNDS